MKLLIDTDARTIELTEGERATTMPLYSTAAFEQLSRVWVKLGWAVKYSYNFSWLGRPVIQLPEDLVRMQEVIHRVQPDVIVETGVAHGGSLIFYASLCAAMGRGRVVGVDIQIRAPNRAAIEGHPLGGRISLIEGDSTASATLDRVKNHIRDGETVLVILDSNHTKAHVSAELEAYRHLVTPGSYLVATDGIMHDLHDVPGGDPSWQWDNPTAAAREFADAHDEFVLEQPPWPFRESELRENITYWPGAWLRRQ